MLVVNFKNYKFGREALNLVHTIDIHCSNAILAVPAMDIAEISKNTTLPVYAQHVDEYEAERATGYIIPEVLQAAGAKGSLLNHSEHRISPLRIPKILERAHADGLKVVLCVKSVSEAKKYAKLKPYAVAFEDPALIATGKSITSHREHSLHKFVEALKSTDIIPLCGAGISSADDVREALLVGCKGVLVASAIAHSPNPEKFLKETAIVFQNYAK